jgi:hypothetical protein
MDAPAQCTQCKEIWPASTAPLPITTTYNLPRQLQAALQQLPHRVLLRATVLEDLFDQDSVVGSGGFDSDSDGIDY